MGRTFRILIKRLSTEFFLSTSVMDYITKPEWHSHIPSVVHFCMLGANCPKTLDSLWPLWRKESRSVVPHHACATMIVGLIHERNHFLLFGCQIGFTFDLLIHRGTSKSTLKALELSFININEHLTRCKVS